MGKTNQSNIAKKEIERWNVKKECVMCNSKNKLCVHHKDQNRNNNSIKNLCYLCSKCHSKYHITKNIPKTSMRVSRDFLNFLKEKGVKGETFEDVIWRLIKQGKKKK